MGFDETGIIMRSKEFINELFSSKKVPKLSWSYNGTVATAKVAPRKKLRIHFTNEYNTTSVEFSINDQFDLTGGGDVSVIFATVIEAIKDFVTIDPREDSLYFTASEQSRARMYDTLAKRVSKQLGWHVVPYDDMVADKKYQNAIAHGDFAFAIEKGVAPEHRQDAQKPQHGEFLPIYYVYSLAFPELPAIKIKASRGYEAEDWVRKNIPEYKGTTQGGMITTKLPPDDRTIIDKGTMPNQPMPSTEPPNSLGTEVGSKLGKLK